MIYKMILLFCLLLSSSFVVAQQSAINWINFEELARNRPADKVIIVYIHSSWCDKCRKMKELTLESERVANYINSHLIAISFDAQTKQDVIFKNKTFSFSRSLGKGYNELALELTKERLILPSTVLLDKNLNIIQSIPGLKTPEELYPILVYFGENHYNTTPWKIFKQNFN